MQHPPYSVPLVDAQGKVTRPWVATIDQFSTTTVGTSTIGVSLHNDLTGRDSDDCHPITAITNLSSQLTSIENAIDAVEVVNATQNTSIASLQTSVGIQSQINSQVSASLANKLEYVVVDGVTITGSGVVGDPLVVTPNNVDTPLFLETDDVGTNTALQINASTSTTDYLRVETLDTVPSLTLAQGDTHVTIEPTTIHAHASNDVEYTNLTALGMQVFDFTPGNTSEVVISAHDVTRNGISAFDAGSTSPERSTGLLTWTGVKLVKVDATHVGVGALTGVIVDTAGAITDITYAGTASVLDAFVATTFNTYFTIDNTGSLIQRSAHPTPQQAREEIYLGYSVHAPVGTITIVTATPDISVNTMSQVRDVINDGMGIVNKGIRPQANGANLQLNMLGGYLYSMGINFVNNALDPARLQFTALTPATFQYRTRTGAATGNLTSMEVGYYDVAGTRTAISGSKYSTQRVYVSPAGLVRLQYGQVTYNSLATALAALPSESFVTYPAFQQNLVLVGSITVLSTATALNGLTQAVFTPASIFGELVVSGGGTSTTTLQGAYSNSTEPEIILDATRGAVSIKAITDANNSLEILNSAGSTTASITGAGRLDAISIYTPSISSSAGLSISPATTLGIGGSGNVTISCGGYVTINTMGNITYAADNTYDIGIDATRPRYIWTRKLQVDDAQITSLISPTIVSNSLIKIVSTMAPASGRVRIGVSTDAAITDPDGTLQVGAYSGDYAGLWAGGITPATTNYAIRAGTNATLINAPLVTDNVYVRHADTTNVMFRKDVLATPVSVSNVTGAQLGGYSNDGWGIWAGNIVPSASNFAFWAKGDGTTMAVNATTSVGVAISNSTKLTINATAITAALPVVLGTGTSTTSGALYNVANRGMVNYTNGPRLMVGTVFRGATGTTLTNSTTETAISTTAAWGTATLPANILQAGTQVRVRLMINVTNSTVSNTLTVKVKIGGTLIWAFVSANHFTLPHAFDVIAYTAAAPSGSSLVMGGGYCDGYFGASGITTNNLATSGALAVTATMTWQFANASSVTGYIAGIDIL